jgi:hypothetical protein
LEEEAVTIAGIKFFFFIDGDGVESSPGNETGIEKEAEGISFRVHNGSLPEIVPQEVIFDSGHTWALYRSRGKYVLQDDTLESDSSPNTFVVLESDFKSGDIFTRLAPSYEKGHYDPLGYPLSQILMILLLSLGRGILLHACGIVDGESGYLFLGNSGHGKTTMARLWKENQCSVLNDDRIVVREKGDRFWMYGTPWHGDLADWSLKGVPIRKIFFLNADEENSAIPKVGVEAVSMILKRSFPPIWDESGMTYEMELCERLVEKTPCYELHFEPDKRVVDFVRGLADK